MRFASVVARTLSTSFVAVGVMTMAGGPVLADTQVGAQICGSDSHAGLVVTSPHSDSIVASPTVTFRGDATQASEVMTAIDGSYDQTVALPVGQTNFSVDVTLSQGTHTVQLTAVDVCGRLNATIQVVVSYQPQVSSEGAQIATRPAGTPVVVEHPSPPPVASRGPFGPFPPVLTRIGDALDILPDNGVSSIQQFARVGLVSIGLAVLAFGAATPLIGSVQLVVAGSKIGLAGVAPRLIGVILLAIGLIL